VELSLGQNKAGWGNLPDELHGEGNLDSKVRLTSEYLKCLELWWLSYVSSHKYNLIAKYFEVRSYT